MKAAMRLIATAFASILISTLVEAGPASAQTPSLQGSYTLDSGASQDIKTAVDKVADQMSFFIRSIVRDRLMAANPPIRTVAISFASNDVTITWNGSTTVTTQTNGTPIDWVAPDGEKGKVATVWAGPVLKRTLTSSNGQRLNAYSLDPTGKMLTLQITVSSSQLPAPVNYKLVFRKS